MASGTIGKWLSRCSARMRDDIAVHCAAGVRCGRASCAANCRTDTANVCTGTVSDNVHRGGCAPAHSVALVQVCLCFLMCAFTRIRSLAHSFTLSLDVSVAQSLTRSIHHTFTHALTPTPRTHTHSLSHTHNRETEHPPHLPAPILSRLDVQLI